MFSLIPSDANDPHSAPNQKKQIFQLSEIVYAILATGGGGIMVNACDVLYGLDSVVRRTFRLKFCPFILALVAILYSGTEPLSQFFEDGIMRNMHMSLFGVDQWYRGRCRIKKTNTLCCTTHYGRRMFCAQES